MLEDTVEAIQMLRKQEAYFSLSSVESKVMRSAIAHLEKTLRTYLTGKPYGFV